VSTTTHVPVEVYLKSSDYEPDAEYVDGEIEERPMGQWDHASWQQAIQKWFWARELQWGVRVRPELRVRVAPSRFRVPDVTLVDADRPVEQIITHPPLAVFEVLSPEDTVKRLNRKLEDYAAMGIPQIWVVDPENGAFRRYREGELRREEHFEVPGKGISFPIREIASLVD
jgi:Uma2 family endonuclease